jgi:anaerobic magnesium-protoporphyrin IX monomethyl ester cyclase
MHTLLINPPYQTITSNRGVGHQVPLGLLMVGGALRDAGFDVSLLDAEALTMNEEHIAD